MSAPLLLPVCTFLRVFDTRPEQEVLTLPELTTSLRRFEIKRETAAKIEREVVRIQRGAARLVAGEPPRGKFMGKLHTAAEAARRRGDDPVRAIHDEADALIMEARKSAKRDLRLWSPALYRPGADKRGSQNVTHVSCLVLDYDDGTAIPEASTTWGAWFHLVYTTWSHTPDHPRFRLVLPLAFSVPAEDWDAVWSWAEEHAHFTIDPSMKSPAATYALPSIPHPEAPREAFSRPGAILDPVDEGILKRRSDLELAPKRPPEGTPSAMRGEDPEKEYLEHEDPSAVYLVEEMWEENWDAPPEVVAALRAGGSGSVRPSTEPTRTNAVPPVEEGARATSIGSVQRAPEEAVMSSGGDLGVFTVEVVERLERIAFELQAGRPGEIAEALERLLKLHQDGALTSEEWQLAKRRVLSVPDPIGEDPGHVDPRRVGKGRHRKTICVDFDGVIHSYASGWKGPTVLPDPPVEGAIEWLTRVAERFDLAIASVRNGQPGAIEAMRAWLSRHGLPAHVLERVRFPLHKPPAEVYIDDRAYRFEGSFPTLDELGALQPWSRGRSVRGASSP